MSGKRYKVTAAAEPEPPQNIKAALEMAEKTGTLRVPETALLLTVPSGIQVEVKSGR